MELFAVNMCTYSWTRHSTTELNIVQHWKKIETKTKNYRQITNIGLNIQKQQHVNTIETIYTTTVRWPAVLYKICIKFEW